VGSLVVMDRAEVFRKALDSARAGGATVGLVPTMGALHEGHRSLVRRSAAECVTTVVTIFVNPLQFPSGDDLATYPRDLAGDLVAAEATGAGMVFAPTEAELWPDGPPATKVVVAGVEQGMEGAGRPGHFAGVATVLSTLFNLAGPCRAYFGEKDFQQLAVVRRLAADLWFPVDVVGCATVREPDGVACSSRNARLSPAERAAATVLYRALLDGAEAVTGGNRDADHLRRVMADRIGAEPLAVLDYAEVVDAATLVPLPRVTGDARLLVAARFGDTRLIDNLGVTA